MAWKVEEWDLTSDLDERQIRAIPPAVNLAVKTQACEQIDPDPG